jgi:CheY-like chemotaxis protein
MGGSIQVESELGKGSTFSMFLPGFIPETISSSSAVPTEPISVLLYEKRIGHTVLNDQGSVARAMKAAGLNVSRIYSLLQLQSTLGCKAIEILAVECEDVCAPELQEFLAINGKVILLVMGKPIKGNLQETRYKHRTRVVTQFPTSDEIKEALSPVERKMAPNVDAYCLGNPGRDLRVLLAEDNIINVKVMRRLLGKFPCKVDVACNGFEAVAAAASGNYDLILMDMLMPEMDGLDATKIIRRTDQKTPIIALTANATTSDRDSCFEAGMSDFLTKPISLDVLCDALNQVATAVKETEACLEAKLESPEPMSYISLTKANGRCRSKSVTKSRSNQESSSRTAL